MRAACSRRGLRSDRFLLILLKLSGSCWRSRQRPEDDDRDDKAQEDDADVQCSRRVGHSEQHQHTEEEVSSVEPEATDKEARDTLDAWVSCIEARNVSDPEEDEIQRVANLLETFDRKVTII